MRGLTRSGPEALEGGHASRVLGHGTGDPETKRGFVTTSSSFWQERASAPGRSGEGRGAGPPQAEGGTRGPRGPEGELGRPTGGRGVFPTLAFLFLRKRGGRPRGPASGTRQVGGRHPQSEGPRGHSLRTGPRRPGEHAPGQQQLLLETGRERKTVSSPPKTGLPETRFPFGNWEPGSRRLV